MLRLCYFLLLAASLATPFFIAGCNTNSAAKAPADGNDHDHDEKKHEAHDHHGDHKGPHGGHVIELGKGHAYHAEIVEDEDAGVVTVYILDKDIKELAIKQQAITMNLMVAGEAKTFELVAMDATDGTASQFGLIDAALVEALHEHEVSGKLRVTIDGTPFIGKIEHHDQGDGHGHNHDDDDAHEN